MTKRLQVSFKDSEFREIQRMARTRHVSVQEWVRQTLLEACQRQSIRDVDRKLAAIRAAVLGDYPSGDIETILSEIESERLHGCT